MYGIWVQTEPLFVIAIVLSECLSLNADFSPPQAMFCERFFLTLHRRTLTQSNAVFVFTFIYFELHRRSCSHPYLENGVKRIAEKPCSFVLYFTE